MASGDEPGSSFQTIHEAATETERQLEAPPAPGVPPRGSGAVGSREVKYYPGKP